MPKSDLHGTAYSYLRFSSPRQERGDSIKRQTEARDKWLAEHPGVVLAADGDYRELGTSSFRGKHRLDDKAALKGFIEAVESGRVKPGSILIVESFDRLTREEFGEAAEFVLGLVNRGIRIVQLSPTEVVLEKPVDLTKALILVVELTRGHGESKRKSDAVASAWRAKREACRTAGKLVTVAAKAWLEIRDGRLVFKPGARALIRRIFAMATRGHGYRTIVKTLNAEGTQTWVGGLWYESYVRQLLQGREVLGEYRQAQRTPEGKRVIDPEPVLGYFPAAVTEAEWLAAQSAIATRTSRGGGRPAGDPLMINIFHGILRDARTGDRMHILTRPGRKVLMPAGCNTRGEPGSSFPLAVLEAAVLSQLAELNPREIIGGDDGPDEVAELNAKLARLDAQLQAMADQFDGDEIPQIAAKAKAKNAERRAVIERLDAAKAKAASPLSAAWGTCRGLAETLRAAKDVREARVRLRQALARIVDVMTCLIVCRDPIWIAALQIHFTGGASRVYFIFHRGGRGSGAPSRRAKRSWAVVSGTLPAQTRTRFDPPDLTTPEGFRKLGEQVAAALANPGEFDLREADDVKVVEDWLTRADLSKLPV